MLVSELYLSKAAAEAVRVDWCLEAAARAEKKGEAAKAALVLRWALDHEQRVKEYLKYAKEARAY